MSLVLAGSPGEPGSPGPVGLAGLKGEIKDYLPIFENKNQTKQYTLINCSQPVKVYYLRQTPGGSKQSVKL